MRAAFILKKITSNVQTFVFLNNLYLDRCDVCIRVCVYIYDEEMWAALDKLTDKGRRKQKVLIFNNSSMYYFVACWHCCYWRCHAKPSYAMPMRVVESLTMLRLCRCQSTFLRFHSLNLLLSSSLVRLNFNEI